MNTCRKCYTISFASTTKHILINTYFILNWGMQTKLNALNKLISKLLWTTKTSGGDIIRISTMTFCRKKWTKWTEDWSHIPWLKNKCSLKVKILSFTVTTGNQWNHLLFCQDWNNSYTWNTILYVSSKPYSVMWTEWNSENISKIDHIEAWKTLHLAR